MTTPWLALAGAALLLAGCATVNSGVTPADEQADAGPVSEGEAIAAQLGYRVPRVTCLWSRRDDTISSYACS